MTAKSKTAPATNATELSASQRIDQRIQTLGGWRGETLARMRALILEADPDAIEECKWVKPTNPFGVPVWSHDGILCTGEVYAKAVKLTFAKGASLPDPSGLFNASLEGNMRRAIDIAEGVSVDARAFKALIQAAVAHNAPALKAKKKLAKTASPKKPRLLAGGNPQIAKGDGDAPVEAYIEAMPGWKQEAARWLDEVITASVPNVKKAMRWNTAFYGVEGQGHFLGFHALTRSMKVAFIRGTSLKPMPPGASKTKDTRYLELREDDARDAVQLKAWVKQAAKLPGWTP